LNVRSLDRTGSLTTMARKLSRNRLDEGVVQGIRWEKAVIVRAEDCSFLGGKGNKNHRLRTGGFLYTRE